MPGKAALPVRARGCKTILARYDRAMTFLRLLLILAAGLLCDSLVLAQVEIPALRAKAEKGDASAQNNLGVAYQNGQGLVKDDAEAVKWYRKAAEQGLALAQYNLGFVYYNGQGVPKDYAEAVKGTSNNPTSSPIGYCAKRDE